MALPEDWNGVDWNATIINLPAVTNGIKTAPINRSKVPHPVKGYYMLATTYTPDNPLCYNLIGAASGEPVVVYIASDVGEGKSLVSQFVFMHEVGHLRLGHISGLAAAESQTTPSHTAPAPFRKEIEADVYSLNHWLSHKTTHGLNVISAAISYLKTLNSPGDSEHPSSVHRAQFLEHCLGQRTFIIFLLNDDSITEDFARNALIDLNKQMPTTTINIVLALQNATSRGRTDVTTAISLSEVNRLKQHILSNPSIYAGLKFDTLPA